MKNYFIKMAGIILVSLCLYCFTSTVFAAPTRTYDVQVLIFSHITPDTLKLQQWPTITPIITNNINNTTANVPSSASNLQTEKQILMRNPNYKMLLDASWMESWSGDQSTINIPVASTNGKLNGSIAITLGHYFNVNADLYLTEPTAFLRPLDLNNYFSKWNQPSFTFQLLQNRRMRSDELNYFEHPLIGMLIKIIPITNPNEKPSQ